MSMESSLADPRVRPSPADRRACLVSACTRAGRWGGRLLQHPLPALDGSAGATIQDGQRPVASRNREWLNQGRLTCARCRYWWSSSVVRLQTRVRGGCEDHRRELRVLCDALRRHRVATRYHDCEPRWHPPHGRAVAAGPRSPATSDAGSGRSRGRTGQGHLGSGGLRSSRVAVVHRNHPALVARRGKRWAAEQLPRHRGSGAARVRGKINASGCCRSTSAAGRTVVWIPLGVGPHRHGGLPQPARPPGVHRRISRYRRN